ncbi:MAG: hypothetical protein IKZ56_03110 [Bacteroidales bacterium]|nr:hypothetical protein [Bacteroidales bacterium]
MKNKLLTIERKRRLMWRQLRPRSCKTLICGTQMTLCQTICETQMAPCPTICETQMTPCPTICETQMTP